MKKVIPPKATSTPIMIVSGYNKKVLGRLRDKLIEKNKYNSHYKIEEHVPVGYITRLERSKGFLFMRLPNNGIMMVHFLKLRKPTMIEEFLYYTHGNRIL